MIAKDVSLLGRLLVSAVPPIAIVRQEHHYAWLTNLGNPQSITLEVGGQVIFEDAPYPLQWMERFRLQEDGNMQTLGIFASGRSDRLRIFYHNLQAEAHILLDGVPAVTIRPDTGQLALRVRFDKSEAVSSLRPDDRISGEEIEVEITGKLELDDDRTTFDGSFRGADKIKLGGGHNFFSWQEEK